MCKMSKMTTKKIIKIINLIKNHKTWKIKMKKSLKRTFIRMIKKLLKNGFNRAQMLLKCKNFNKLLNVIKTP